MSLCQLCLKPYIVNLVHINMRQNIRQPYAIRLVLSLDTLVELSLQLQEFQMVSQSVFRNVCHGGLVFSPNKTCHLWHYRVNTTQKQYALSVSWLPQSFQLWWCLRVIILRKSLNYLWWWKIKLNIKKTKKVLLCLNDVKLRMISEKSISLCEWELACEKWEMNDITSLGSPGSLTVKTILFSRPSETLLVS